MHRELLTYDTDNMLWLFSYAVIHSHTRCVNMGIVCTLHTLLKEMSLPSYSRHTNSLHLTCVYLGALGAMEHASSATL